MINKSKVEEALNLCMQRLTDKPKGPNKAYSYYHTLYAVTKLLDESINPTGENNVNSERSITKNSGNKCGFGGHFTVTREELKLDKEAHQESSEEKR